MPLRIPQYQPQVGVRAAPGGPGPIQVSAEGVRMHARAQQAQAQSLQAMGNVVAGIHDDMKRAAAAEEVLKVQASFKEFLTEQQAWKEQALTERVGTRAMGLYQDADNHWATQIERAAEGLTPRQAEKFLEFATQARPGFLASMSRHQASEAQRTTLQTNEELVVLHGDELTEALLAGDMDSVQLAMDRLRSARGQQAAMTGATQEWLNGRIRMDRNKATATALGAMLERKDWGNAGRLLEADDKRPFEQQWLTSDQRSSARSRIEAGARQDRIVQATDWYYLENQGSMTEALAAVRENVPADIRFDVERSVTARFQEAEFLREKESEAKTQALLGQYLQTSTLQQAMDLASTHPDPIQRHRLMAMAREHYGMQASAEGELAAVQTESDRIWNDRWDPNVTKETMATSVRQMIADAESLDQPHLREAVRAHLLDRLRLEQGLDRTTAAKDTSRTGVATPDAIGREMSIALLRDNVAAGLYNPNDQEFFERLGAATLAAGGSMNDFGDLVQLARSRHGRPAAIMSYDDVTSFISGHYDGAVPENLKKNMLPIYNFILDHARVSGIEDKGHLQAMIAEMLIPARPTGWRGQLPGMTLIEAKALGLADEWTPDPTMVDSIVERNARALFAERRKDPRVSLLDNALRIAVLNQNAGGAYLKIPAVWRDTIEHSVAQDLRRQHGRDVPVHPYEVVRAWKAALAGQGMPAEQRDAERRAEAEQTREQIQMVKMAPLAASAWGRFWSPRAAEREAESAVNSIYAQRRETQIGELGRNLTSEEEQELWDDSIGHVKNLLGGNLPLAISPQVSVAWRRFLHPPELPAPSFHILHPWYEEVRAELDEWAESAGVTFPTRTEE